MKVYENSVGVLVPEILLPPKGTDMYKWAVVACDQFTSQKEYWEEARRIIGDAPSTLDLILPEAWLGAQDEQERIARIKEKMQEYLHNGTLVKQPQGFVLVERTAAGNTRHGLVMALDLEKYDYSKGSGTLIRATEGTIVERIPPRLRIREGAAVELPHILVLIDDPEETVIEPLAAQAEKLPLLYDTDLMLGGGHISGRLVSGEKEIMGVLEALTALSDKAAFEKKYGSKPVLLFAMGDGNHSLATAKANWEKIKATLPEEQREDHPARYALIELNNVHDKGIVFEAIHRNVFGIPGEKLVEALLQKLREQNGGAEIGPEQAPAGGEKHVIPFYYGDKSGAFIVTEPAVQLAVGTLQNAIDAVLKELGGEVDYIHGIDVVKELAQKPDTTGFLLPDMEKSELFPTVVYDGALPRKTFSMGEAAEKRYYMEARLLEK
ncbi:MAG: DUF1015 domain-containing protein [Eubacteriales bacterium]|nr:DUF1015 domain-containing protein [Eubacteriales bacterium]